VTETDDLQSSRYFLELAGKRYDLSLPERGDSGEELGPVGAEDPPGDATTYRVSFGLLPAQAAELEHFEGAQGRVVNALGEELILFRVDHVFRDLNVVVGLPELPESRRWAHHGRSLELEER
jgi:hypothetical protein